MKKSKIKIKEKHVGVKTFYEALILVRVIIPIWVPFFVTNNGLELLWMVSYNQSSYSEAYANVQDFIDLYGEDKVEFIK